MFANSHTVRSVDVTSGAAVIEAKVTGHGAAVVLIAGLASGVSDLDRLMQAVAGAGFQAIAINMRGAGHRLMSTWQPEVGSSS